MKAKIFAVDGQQKGEMELADTVFNVDANGHVLHQVVVSYLANRRQGTAKTKGRAEVSGGGAKPWRQKGTGRARSGSNTSPVWVRGGKAFGAGPRDYTVRIPRTMRKQALRSALSSRARDAKVLVVDGIKAEAPKTKGLALLLKNLSVAGMRNLLVVDSSDRNIYLSGRNIRNLSVKPYSQVNAFDILDCENLIFGSEDLVRKLQEVAAQ